MADLAGISAGIDLDSRPALREDQENEGFVMAGELMIGLTAFKATIEAASAIRTIKNEHDRALAVFEVVQKLSTLQNDYLLLATRHQELADENASLKSWADEKGKYELFSPANGTFAYRTKDRQSSTEPSHSICANCYQNGKKSILQTEIQDVGRRVLLACHGCGNTILTFGDRGLDNSSPGRRR